MKRCKGCVFYLPYAGEIENEAIRKMMNLQAPKRSTRACTLRLRPGKEEGEEATPTFDKRHPAGPRYGKRLSPNATCAHHTAKIAPYRKPPSAVISEDLEDVVVPPLANVVPGDAIGDDAEIELAV